MSDTVTAKLAEWEALTEGATEGPWGYWGQGWIAPVRDPQCDPVGVPQNRIPRNDADAAFIAAAPTIARALLGFVREVLATHVVSKVEHRCVNCECPWPCPTEQAARKWIGGEG